mgnify:FL=1
MSNLLQMCLMIMDTASKNGKLLLDNKYIVLASKHDPTKTPIFITAKSLTDAMLIYRGQFTEETLNLLIFRSIRCTFNRENELTLSTKRDMMWASIMADNLAIDRDILIQTYN